mmetsp:Transcript_10471/g.16423  ORF Transcript_10471/g.16423 Transcript_10471/m.16423 type:complete len:409 (-) Transcript_10471:147-1373(-)
MAFIHSVSFLFGKMVRLGNIRHTNVFGILLVVRCQIGGVNVLGQLIERRCDTLLGLFDLVLHILSNTLFDLLELFRSHVFGIDQALFDKFQGISGGAGEFDFLAVAVGRSRIGHGVTVIPVGHHFEVDGSVAASGVFLGKADALLDGQDVHTIDAKSGDGISHFVVVADGRVTIDGGSHTVVVVFNAENHGQLPQVTHVGRLPNLSLIGRTISIAGNRHGHFLTRRRLVLGRKGQSSSQRNLSPDNTGSSKEIVLLVVHMHTSTLPLGISINDSKELTDDLPDASTPCQGDAMTSVTGHPRIGLIERVLNSRRDGFLTVVQMAKSTDRPRLVFVVAGNFHTSHRVHQFEHAHQFLLAGFDAAGGGGVQIVGFKTSRQIETRHGSSSGHSEPSLLGGDHAPKRSRSSIE